MNVKLLKSITKTEELIDQAVNVQYNYCITKLHYKLIIQVYQVANKHVDMF